MTRTTIIPLMIGLVAFGLGWRANAVPPSAYGQGLIPAGDYYLVDSLPCDGPAIAYHVVHVDAGASGKVQTVSKTIAGHFHNNSACSR